MSAVATAIAASAVIGGVVSSSSASKAAQAQKDAAQMGIDQQNRMFDIQNIQQAPYRGAGYTGLSQIMAGLSGQVPQYDEQGNFTGYTTGTGQFTKPFTSADLNAYMAPNYDFMLKQGQGANLAASNATGGMISGNALRGLNAFTQDYAGNAFQNAFANYTNQNTNIYNRLASVAGIGQTAQNQTSNLAANTAGNIASLGVGGANAAASGIVGQSNAISGALGGVGNAAMYYGLMNRPTGVGMTPTGGSYVNSLQSTNWQAPSYSLSTGG